MSITQKELKLFNHINNLEITNLKLKIDFPYKQIYEEVEPLLDNFIVHRIGNAGSGGLWKSLVVRGFAWDRTADPEPQDIGKQMDWQLEDMLPITTNYFKNFPCQPLEKVRFMLLEPGGVIKPHRDIYSRPKLFGNINFCITQPEGCVFNIGNEIIPWMPGDVRSMNLWFEHTVVNKSNKRRLVMIAHQSKPIVDERFIKIALESYSEI